MKVTKKTVFEVAGRDLEDFVQEHYGREFNIAADQERAAGRRAKGLIAGAFEACSVLYGVALGGSVEGLSVR